MSATHVRSREILAEARESDEHEQTIELLLTVIAMNALDIARSLEQIAKTMRRST